MNDEYISRNEAINAIKSLESSMPAKDNYAKGYDAALGRVQIAVRAVPPAADVQLVKHGKWVSSASTLETGTVRCSSCRSEMYVDDLFAVSASNGMMPNYCPNCGARMDGGDKDDS